MYNYSMKFIKQYFPHILLGLYLIEFTWLAITPYDRTVWWIENLPIMLAVAGLVFTFHKFRFSNLSYFLMAFFLMFHTVGGHYSFALTPFEFGNYLLEQINAVLHLDFLFPDGRNNFDRVGHYLIGVFAYPIAEIAYIKQWVSKRWLAILLGILALGFWAAFYEIVETIYAVVDGGEAGAAFLGSQGDIWDAQKDMLLDILGAITASVLFVFIYKKK